MSRLFLGVDTSCYTTSVCCVSEEGIVFERRTMLSVPLGDRGLRQSDGVFQHVRNLPPLIDALLSGIDRTAVCAVAVSAKPTADEDSYMPVFLAGKLAAVSVADALGVPLLETTHQAGHIRAAMLDNEYAIPKDEPFLAMHLSGGTTDLLSVRLVNGTVGAIERIGGCSDLHAGQFVDRVGGQARPAVSERERAGAARPRGKTAADSPAFKRKGVDMFVFRAGVASPAFDRTGRSAGGSCLRGIRLHGTDVLKNAAQRHGTNRLSDRAAFRRRFRQRAFARTACRAHEKAASVCRHRTFQRQCHRNGSACPGQVY